MQQKCGNRISLGLAVLGAWGLFAGSLAPVAISSCHAEASAATATSRLSGEQVFNQVCFACHLSGMAGAPRVTQRHAWKPRVAKGIDVLVEHAINGFNGHSGSMPPRGNAYYLSDEEVRAAVEYIVRIVADENFKAPEIEIVDEPAGSMSDLGLPGR